MNCYLNTGSCFVVENLSVDDVLFYPLKAEL